MKPFNLEAFKEGQNTALIEEDEAEDYFKQFKGFVKTNRSWEMEI